MGLQVPSCSTNTQPPYTQSIPIWSSFDLHNSKTKQPSLDSEQVPGTLWCCEQVPIGVCTSMHRMPVWSFEVNSAHLIRFAPGGFRRSLLAISASMNRQTLICEAMISQ